MNYLLRTEAFVLKRYANPPGHNSILGSESSQTVRDSRMYQIYLTFREESTKNNFRVADDSPSVSASRCAIRARFFLATQCAAGAEPAAHRSLWKRKVIGGVAMLRLPERFAADVPSLRTDRSQAIPRTAC